MLLIARQVRTVFAHCVPPDAKLPAKGKAVFFSSPYAPSGIGVWWTDRKSDCGDRLFNCGQVRTDGSQPPLFGI